MKELDTERLKNIYNNQAIRGRNIMEWQEWEEKVRKAYAILAELAKQGNTITYSELGIGKLGISTEWLEVKIGWIVGACSEYELEDGNPLLSSLVRSKETNRPGAGYWGFPNMPSHILSRNWEDRRRNPPESVVAEREVFWISELNKVYKHWQECDC